MMAPVQRYTHLLDTAAYAVIYGLIHTVAILIVMMLFFPQLDLTGANFASAAMIMAVESFSFVKIRMMATILPLLYVKRNAQMTFVIQSVLLLVSGIYYSISILPK